MPYDYLGTFTQNQLRERHSFLRAQVHALPGVIETLKAQRDRLGSLVLQDSAETFTITAEVCGKTYTLGTSAVPAFRPGHEIEMLHHGAINSRFPMRYDPLTGNYSHGDHAFRTEPRLLQVGDMDSGTNLDLFPDDDSIPAQRTLRVTREFSGVGKRADAIETRVQKLQYRYLVLSDEIERKERLLAEFEDELTAIEAFLTDEVEVTGTDGTTRTESDYPSAGADQKTDVTDPADVDRLYDLFLPPVAEPEDEDQDQPRATLLPADLDTLQIVVTDGSDPGDVEEFLEEFPIPGYNISDQKRLQLMANVYEYGYKTGIMAEIVDSTSLVRSDRGVGGPYRYLPPNVLADMQALAAEVYDTWSIRLRITEAWPATVYHSSAAHFTGNCVDLVMDFDGPNGAREGFTLPDLAQAILNLGVRRGLIRGGLNEYAQESRHSTGKHLHFNCNIQYFNEGALWRL